MALLCQVHSLSWESRACQMWFQERPASGSSRGHQPLRQLPCSGGQAQAVPQALLVPPQKLMPPQAMQVVLAFHGQPHITSLDGTFFTCDFLKVLSPEAGPPQDLNAPGSAGHIEQSSSAIKPSKCSNSRDMLASSCLSKESVSLSCCPVRQAHPTCTQEDHNRITHTTILRPSFAQALHP